MIPVGRLESLPHVGRLESLPHLGRLESLPHLGRLESLPHLGRLKSLPHLGRLESLPHLSRLESLPHEPWRRFSDYTTHGWVWVVPPQRLTSTSPSATRSPAGLPATSRIGTLTTSG